MTTRTRRRLAFLVFAILVDLWTLQQFQAFGVWITVAIPFNPTED